MLSNDKTHAFIAKKEQKSVIFVNVLYFILHRSSLKPPDLTLSVSRLSCEDDNNFGRILTVPARF